MNDPILDVAIIGAGPIGIACGIEAKKNNLSFVLLEKGVLVNSVYNFPSKMTFFSTSRLLEIGGVPFISDRDKPTRDEALEYFRRVVEHWELPIRLYEAVQSMDSEEGLYRLQTNKATYRARHVIVATGFYDTPNPLNIPGHDLPKVSHYYNDPHPYLGQEVAIIGAGNSACDAALECYLKGARVSMIVRKPHIKPTVKYWIKPNIENRIKEGSIRGYFESNVLSIHQDYIVVQTPSETLELPNDFVLALIGYQPNYDFLTTIGLQFDQDEFLSPICNQQTLETNLPRVYIAGVVCGGMKTNRLFIENSRVHAEMIVQNILAHAS